MTQITGKLEYVDMGSGEWYITSPALEGRRVRVFPETDAAFNALGDVTALNNSIVTIKGDLNEDFGTGGLTSTGFLATEIIAHVG